jgi:hypothetical protein
MKEKKKEEKKESEKKSKVTLYWESLKKRGGPDFEIVDMKAILK